MLTMVMESPRRSPMREWLATMDLPLSSPMLLWPLLTLPLDTVSSHTLPLLTLPLDTVSSPTLPLLTLLLPTPSPSLTLLCLSPILVRKGCVADYQNILNNYLIYLLFTLYPNKFKTP